MPRSTETTIRTRRVAAKLSIRDLERLTGINRGRLSIIERGVAPTSAETELIRLAFATVQA